MLKASYILPIRRLAPADEELAAYVRWLRGQIEVIVVDGSPAEVFAANGDRWLRVKHVAPDGDLKGANGKVRGVVTGLRLASHDRVVIADDDVRYDATSLRQVLAGLKLADVVRPQNYFQPLPWHAFWDTGRILLNRALDGDWPGTLAVRRSYLSYGYDANCLFENLELVRTVRAAGGREHVARDVFVRRLPPPAKHFLSQRIRQAYDEFARPLRFVVQLALLPATVWLALRRPRLLVVPLLGTVALAEAGRRRSGGAAVFPAWTSLAAPFWLAERMLGAWIAVGSRLALGGVRYHGGTISRAATPQRVLEARHEPAEAEETPQPLKPAEAAPRAQAANRRTATKMQSARKASKTPEQPKSVRESRPSRTKPAAHPRGTTSRARKSA